MKQKRSFDQRQRAPSLDTLMSGDHACIPQSQTKGMVLTEVAPRSYQLTTPSGVLRRNRRQLRWLSSSSNTTGEEDTAPLDDPGHQHTSAACTIPDMEESRYLQTVLSLCEGHKLLTYLLKGEM